MKTPITTAIALAAITATAPADPLPRDAQPLGTGSVAGIYAGTTVDWGKSRALFTKDGKVKGISTRNGTTLFWGSWSVAGNEICMRNEWRNVTTGEAGTVPEDCWKWYVDSQGEPWTLWSRHFDKTPADTKNGYYKGEAAKMRRGDGVSAEFDKLFR